MADFGNIAGVVKKFTEPLNADLSPKTFVLWAKEKIAAGDEVTLMRYDFVTSSWVPLSSEESVYKVDAATDINQLFVGVTDIDGITLVNGNRVLLFGQTDPIENGIYVSDGAGALSRPPRFSTSVLGDHLVIALGGTSNKFGEWMPTNTSNVDGFIVDTDPIEYVQTHVNSTVSVSTVANLGYTAAPTQGKITNSNGTSAVLTLATTTNAGLLAPADKDGIDKVIQLSGRPIGSADLGTFTGGTIGDNVSIKLALQQLETTVEAVTGSIKTLQIEVFPRGTAVTTGDSTLEVGIGSSLDGYNLINVVAIVEDKGVSAGIEQTTVQVERRTNNSIAGMLSTLVSIGDEYFAEDGVIDAAFDNVSTGDKIKVNVAAVHITTPPNGLVVVMEFQLP